MLPKDFGKAHHGADPYDTPFYRRLRSWIDFAIARRWSVIGITVVALAAAIVGSKYVPQQFFPNSSRPELVVELRLKEGSSFAATTEQVKRLEAVLAKDEDVKFFTAYTGAGQPRFYLALNPELPNPGYAAFIVMLRSSPDREFHIANVVLVAPDLDADVAITKIFKVFSDPDLPFGENAEPGALLPPARGLKVSLYVSPDDRAIATASLLFGSIARLGRIDAAMLTPEQIKAIGMNREEIEWITQNLFVGNKLWSGGVKAGPTEVFDLRDIKVPIVLFASAGDNITPPQQAFNWVADVYGSTEEIKARGQVIVGLMRPRRSRNALDQLGAARVAGA